MVLDVLQRGLLCSHFERQHRATNSKACAQKLVAPLLFVCSLPSGLYRRPRSYTESADLSHFEEMRERSRAFGFRQFTAGGELHPALRTLMDCHIVCTGPTCKCMGSRHLSCTIKGPRWKLGNRRDAREKAQGFGLAMLSSHLLGAMLWMRRNSRLKLDLVLKPESNMAVVTDFPLIIKVQACSMR
jgi:hypothetical protein